MVDWDERYSAAPDGLFGREPSQYLRQVAARSDFAARTALCLADGDGRNSRWLAAKGIATMAVDLSSVATSKALEMDAAAAVEVERIVADLETWQPAAAQRYDLVTVIFLQAPEALRRHALQLAWAALEPGGWLMVEGFAKAQAGRSGGPSDPANLYDRVEIAAALPAPLVIESLAGRVHLEEGRRHHGEMEVVHFLARKAG